MPAAAHALPVAATVLVVGVALGLWLGRSGGSSIEPEVLAARLAAGTAPPILDVRSAGEYRAGHLPGAVHIPFHQVARRAEEVPRPSDGEPLVVYCGHGPRAAIARWQLRRRGIDRATMLAGHYTEWVRLGLPVETDATAPEEPSDG